MTDESITEDPVPSSSVPPSTVIPSVVDPDIKADNAIELLDKLEQSKPETRAVFEAFMATISRTEGSSISSLYPKFTPEHITIFLNGIQEDDNNRASLLRRQQWMNFVLIILGLVIVVSLILILKDNDSVLLDKIIQIAVLVGGGFGAGIGVNASRRRD